MPVLPKYLMTLGGSLVAATPRDVFSHATSILWHSGARSQQPPLEAFVAHATSIQWHSGAHSQQPPSRRFSLTQHLYNGTREARSQQPPLEAFFVHATSIQ